MEKIKNKKWFTNNVVKTSVGVDNAYKRCCLKRFPGYSFQVKIVFDVVSVFNTKNYTNHVMRIQQYKSDISNLSQNTFFKYYSRHEIDKKSKFYLPKFREQRKNCYDSLMN